jgi:hypothetical protein
MRNLFSLEVFLQEKSLVKRLFGCNEVSDGMDSTVSGNGRVDLMQSERGDAICRPPAPS